jgi:hypothetical protein
MGSLSERRPWPPAGTCLRRVQKVTGASIKDWGLKSGDIVWVTEDGVMRWPSGETRSVNDPGDRWYFIPSYWKIVESDDGATA